MPWANLCEWMSPTMQTTLGQLKVRPNRLITNMTRWEDSSRLPNKTSRAISCMTHLEGSSELGSPNRKRIRRWLSTTLLPVIASGPPALPMMTMETCETTIDVKGVITQVSYDNLNRPHQKSYSVPQTSDPKKFTLATPTVFFKYDGLLSPAPSNPNPVLLPFAKGAYDRSI